MKKIALILIGFTIFSFLISCQTSNAFRVPGESAIITKNIASEYFTIADGYADLKKYDKAAEYYKLAMKNKTLRLSAYFKMARCYALAKNYPEAIKCYEDLLKLDKDNKDIQLSLAYLTGMNGNVDESVKLYDQLCQKYPNDETVLENYIRVLIYQGRVEDAEKIFFLLKEKFPNNANLKSLNEKISEQIENPSVDPIETVETEPGK